MPAAMRPTRLCVLPEPAPASTSMLTSRRSRIRSRAAWSGITGGGGPARSLTLAEPPVRRECGIALLLHLDGGAGHGIAPAGPGELAVLAVVRVRRVDERPAGQDVEEVAEHGRDDPRVALRSPHPLASPPAGREVVGAPGDARRRVRRPEELGRGERIERVLELSPPAKVAARPPGRYALPVL